MALTYSEVTYNILNNAGRLKYGDNWKLTDIVRQKKKPGATQNEYIIYIRSQEDTVLFTSKPIEGYRSDQLSIKKLMEVCKEIFES